MAQRPRTPCLALLTVLAASWPAGIRAGADRPGAEESGIACTVSGNDVRLSWNIAFLVAIEGWVIQRDGEALAHLGPQAMDYLDAGAPSGEHRYDLLAIN